jgi:carbonic anhydrase
VQKLVDGLHKFKSEIFNSNQDVFRPLMDGQRPEVLFITCSDSRIAPNLITQTDPGELFIMRNAGNIVPSYAGLGSSEAATIEFAVIGLGVRHIIVCGHTGCGAMKALLKPELADDLPAMRSFLVHAESTRRLVHENYPHLEGPARLTVTVEENVLAQIDSLRTHPAVRSRLARGELSLHGWVYKLETGEVFQYHAGEGQFVHLSASTPMSPVPSTASRARGL